MTRILAVDWGTRRVGLAVSDPALTLARSLPTESVRGIRDAAARVAAAAERENADRILIGLPLNLDGTEGDSARRVRKLGRTLEVRGFTVEFRDERLTSEAALDILRERGETRPEPGRTDAVAAALLLQEYLDDPRDRIAPCVGS